MICISRQVNSYAVFGKPGSSNIFFNYRNLQAYIRTGVHFWRWNPSQQCQIWEQQIKCILRQVCNRLIKNLVKNDRLLISTLISIRYVIGKTCKSNIFFKLWNTGIYLNKGSLLMVKSVTAMSDLGTTDEMHLTPSLQLFNKNGYFGFFWKKID